MIVEGTAINFYSLRPDPTIAFWYACNNIVSLTSVPACVTTRALRWQATIKSIWNPQTT